ncbi:Wzz/FepE/Etk N-terminal domain-containing protein [Staphylococcus hyicus]|uniref:Wzz/FepE/Etk N-terminal domain-containing protein n=1 Tax=Staphylococcus hyicus TaxID=1284 RepID=UPI00208E8C79|nr:Wzz/FepE/Etk N-terminal domain-containing protein [Staphylococcus hyicus]MCO4329157.1 Wzz/FepE/Etk N-terminal domain-containing protein [Staphylococcus hyicus]MCO4337018.1 Wzz/FepE/Etk N-terminal domain-containing protein [Staphylococcus hyicus]
MENTIDLSKTLHILKKYIWLLILSPLILLALSVIITFMLIKPQYEATTQILVNQEKAQDPIQQQQNVQGTLQQVNTYAEIVNSPRILEKVAKNLNNKYSVSSLKSKVEVQSSAQSQVITVNVHADSKSEAEKIANELIKVYKKEMPEIMDINNVSILSKADGTAKQVSPNIPMNLFLGFILGLILALLFIFMKELTDTRIKDEQDIEDHLKLPVLGSIKRF